MAPSEFQDCGPAGAGTWRHPHGGAFVPDGTNTVVVSKPFLRNEGHVEKMSEPATSNEFEKSLIETVHYDSMSLAIVPRNRAETVVERNYAAWARTRRGKEHSSFLHNVQTMIGRRPQICRSCPAINCAIPGSRLGCGSGCNTADMHGLCLLPQPTHKSTKSRAAYRPPICLYRAERVQYNTVCKLPN